MSIVTESDRTAADLGRVLATSTATSGTTYHLHRAPWQIGTTGTSLWLHYTEDGEKRAMLIQDDLPESAIQDIDTYADRADEETRILMAEARSEFGT